MKTSRFFWTFGLLTVLLVALTSPASGGQERVDVCHITGTYDFGQGEVPIGHVISIADPAYETHIAHGDPEVWELRTLPDGSEVCTATVNPVNAPPIALDDAYSTDEDTTLSVSVLEGVLANDADQDGDSLSAVLDTGPSNGALTLDSDGSFTYTPDADYAGTDSFTYVANDGTEDSNIATVIITVDPVNDAPTAADDAYSTDEDVALTVSALGILGNDGDVDGDPLSAALDAGPTHGSLEFSGDGGFTYAPNADYYGPDSFTYHASDDTLDSNIAIVILTVNPVNDAPTAADDAYSTDENVALTVSAPGVLGNDGDVDGDSRTAVLDSGPSNGTLTLNSDGSFTYTPNPDYDGTDSFTYHASDGTLDSDIATVTITVNPVTEPPTEMIVFVTSATYEGASLGGLAGADAKCQAEAAAAGLPGSYKAWLSADGAGNSAAERLVHSEFPYVRVDGVQVADNWADLTDHDLDAPIRLTADGAIAAPYVWTGTAGDGSFVSGSSDCHGWTADDTSAPAVYGDSGAFYHTDLWTWDFGTSCSASLPLYCFQQGGIPVKTVFVTSAAYEGASLGGLTGADAKCQAEADAAGLPGSYKAWLSSSEVDARERLTHWEFPYVRVDGVQVADNWADLTDHDLDAPIRLTAWGEEAGLYVLTGTAFDGSFVSGSSDCQGWTGDDTSAPAVYGGSREYYNPDLWTYDFGTGCSWSLPLYCFQQ